MRIFSFALPPPSYEDAILYPLTSGKSSDALANADDVNADDDLTALPSYETACASDTHFRLTFSSSPAGGRRVARDSDVGGRGGGNDDASPLLLPHPRVTSSPHAAAAASRSGPASSSSSSALPTPRGSSARARDVHDVTIHVTPADDDVEGDSSSLLLSEADLIQRPEGWTSSGGGDAVAEPISSGSGGSGCGSGGGGGSNSGVNGRGRDSNSNNSSGSRGGGGAIPKRSAAGAGTATTTTTTTTATSAAAAQQQQQHQHQQAAGAHTAAMMIHTSSGSGAHRLSLGGSGGGGGDGGGGRGRGGGGGGGGGMSSDPSRVRSTFSRLGLDGHPPPRPRSDDGVCGMRRTSDVSHGGQRSVAGARSGGGGGGGVGGAAAGGAASSSSSSRDLNIPALRSQRSCSDAGVHAVSRTRAVAAAARARGSSSELASSSSSSHPHHHGYQQRGGGGGRHHHKHHAHRSHSCIPGQLDHGAQNGHTSGRRAHSHSSVAKLGTGSRRASSEEEEVTYVWKDGRVQVHHPRGHATTPDFSSGQHVEYMWRNGNVQRVIRGSNHELLSAEVVPPRPEVKGINYCVVFSVMLFFIFGIALLVFVLRVFH